MPNRLSPVVLNLIIINVLVFLFIQFNLERMYNEQWILYFAVFPSNLLTGDIFTFFEPVQVVSYMFTHIEIFHIFFNMFALASIGPPLEALMGPRRFLTLYLFAGLFAGAMIALLQGFSPNFPINAPTVGASGCITGLLVAWAYYYPDQKLGLLFLPFRFSARGFARGFAMISGVFLVLDYAGVETVPISHLGHLAGMLGAVIILYGPRLINPSGGR